MGDARESLLKLLTERGIAGLGVEEEQVLVGSQSPDRRRAQLRKQALSMPRNSSPGHKSRVWTAYSLLLLHSLSRGHHGLEPQHPAERSLLLLLVLTVRADNA